MLAVADIGAKNVFNAPAVLAFFITHHYMIMVIGLLCAFYWYFM
jgi:hypothetical protein